MFKPLIALAVLSLPMFGCTTPAPVRSDKAACSTAIERVAAVRQLSATHVASCEAATDSEVPGYYVVGLWGHCREELCGSTLIGWFAVRKTDGAVFELNVGEWNVGQPVSEQTFHG